MFYFVLLAPILCAICVQAENNKDGSTNIIGGDIVDITDYPYQARLEGPQGLMCGASILTQHHVLCAANCVNLVKVPLTIHTGTSLLSDPGTIHKVEANFTFGINSTDNIAVLRVTEPIVFDKTRQPITLAHNEPEPGLLAYAIGWGYTNPLHVSVSNELRAAQIPIITREECNSLYNGTYVGEITDRDICAGDLVEGGKDSCQGDAGGPLVVNGLQVGITSKGYGCGNSRGPGVYVNIPFYIDWIKEQLLK